MPPGSGRGGGGVSVLRHPLLIAVKWKLSRRWGSIVRVPMLLAAMLIAVSIFASGAIAAGIPYGTLSVKSERISTGGKLFGCYLQFDAIVQDNVYRSGLPTYVGGSLGYTVNSTMLLKLGLRDLTANLESLAPTLPELAFVELADRKNNVSQLLQKHDSEDSSGRLFIYNLDPVMLATLDEIAARRAITIVFNRSKGGSDLRLPLDLTVVKVDDSLKLIHSDEQLRDFAGCLGEMLPLVAGRLQTPPARSKGRP